MNRFAFAFITLFFAAIGAVHASEDTPFEQVPPDKLSYWDSQRKGTNYFNQIPQRAWFQAAHDAGIHTVRFTYEKWQSDQRDFLLGNADNYQGLVKADLKKLLTYLDVANEYDIKVVITPLSLPGARFRQSNANQNDGRLWLEGMIENSDNVDNVVSTNNTTSFLVQSKHFWKDLAGELKDHPAVIGYTLINEPFPEKFYDKKTFWTGDYGRWYQSVKGGSGDLNRFNQQMVNAIREVDEHTPIVLESGLHATPWAFKYLKPVDDERVIYSFHMYEPYEYTTKRINQGKFEYPGKVFIPALEDNFDMNKVSIEQFLSPVVKWAERHSIPANRIWASEFGVDRTMPGAAQYLSDLVEIFNQHKWHWAFYAYREDNWNSMDYELGKHKPYWKYWDYQQAGTLHLHYDELYKEKSNNSVWMTLKKEFTNVEASNRIKNAEHQTYK
ncbi:glycoside hydrolase family 5 protein [Ningiella sp. W23]|uniref:glycoside hydrolase family 5 protein n=1 Tax=Ningiella sp. W23 TaxID=3023715 RepID=UPI003757BB56